MKNQKQCPQSLSWQLHEISHSFHVRSVLAQSILFRSHPLGRLPFILRDLGMLTVSFLGSNIHSMFVFERRRLSSINSMIPSTSKVWINYKKHSSPKNRFNPRHLLGKIIHARYPICSTNGKSIFLLTYHFWLLRSTWKHLSKEASITALLNEETNAFKVILFKSVKKTALFPLEIYSDVRECTGNLFFCQFYSFQSLNCKWFSQGYGMFGSLVYYKISFLYTLIP